MKRRLLALNLLLVAALAYAGYQFHQHRVAARAHQDAALNRRVPPLPPPALAPQPVPPPVTAAAYVDVAQRDLFDQSRNPNVPIELPPPPPPLKDPPPLPTFHGTMNLGDGPFAIMSKNGSARQEEVHAGGMIGDFKLIDFNRKEITLEWDGRMIHKRTDEMGKDDGARAAAGPGAVPAVGGLIGLIPGIAAPPAPPAKLSELGPGPDNGNTFRPCMPGDSSPNGAIADGYRKSIRSTPFGSECHWESVGK